MAGNTTKRCSKPTPSPTTVSPHVQEVIDASSYNSKDQILTRTINARNTKNKPHAPATTMPPTTPKEADFLPTVFSSFAKGHCLNQGLLKLNLLIAKACKKFSRLNMSLWHAPQSFNTQELLELELNNLEWLIKQKAAPIQLASTYSDSWLQPIGLLATLQFWFQNQYPVRDGRYIYPLHYQEGKDINALLRLFFKAGLLVNPPFSDENINRHLNHLLKTAILQQIVLFVIIPYLPHKDWFIRLQSTKVPGIHLTNKLIFLDKNQQVLGPSTNTICILLLGAQGPFLEVNNSPLGSFVLSETQVEQFTFPLAPINYASHQKKKTIQKPFNQRLRVRRKRGQVNSKLFSDLNITVQKACAILKNIQKVGVREQKFPKFFHETMAENNWDYSHAPAKTRPGWLDFQQHQHQKKKKIPGILQDRKHFKKKFTLAQPGLDNCKTCGTTTHETKNCWRAPLTWNMLESTDRRDKIMLRQMRKFQANPLKAIPAQLTGAWFLATFWPHILKEEKKWNKSLNAAFKKSKNDLTEYLQKFHQPFSRTYWGVGFAFALGVHKEAVIRMFFGIPRHNAVASPPYDVDQKIPPKMMHELHKIHVQKVKEGKLAEVPKAYLNGILPSFAIQEKDKTREIVDAFTENICHPPQSVKMVRIEHLLHFPPTSVSMPLDAKSAFDQIKVTPPTTKWQGQTSTDPQGQKHFYAALGLPMGVCYCPKRCQGQLCDMLDPLRKMLTTMKVYIDDLLPICDAAKLESGDITIIFDSILMSIHKLGLKISEKCFPKITSTPTYLGYILDLKNNCFYPHFKHLQKATALIYDALNPTKITTFRNYLQIKGILSFALKERGVRLCQFMDNYTRTQCHAHKRDIKTILMDIMPPSEQFIKFVIEYTKLLNDPENYTFRLKSFHPDANTKILIATDASPEKAGGFCLINGRTPSPLQYFPQVEMSQHFENMDAPYWEQRWRDLLWSSTDIERRALYIFLTEYLHPYLLELDPPRPISIVSLTDSQSLAYQLLQVSNKNSLTNAEIKKCLDILHYWDPNTQIYWHRRSTRLGRKADSYTRDIFSIPDHLLQKLQEVSGHKLSPFLDMHTLKTLNICTNIPTDIITPPEKTLFLVFPHPNLPQKNLIDIVEFLSLHHLNALLLTPGINLTKLILHETKYPTYNLGPLKTLNWPSLPDNLKQKNYPLIAIHLNTPYHA